MRHTLTSLRSNKTGDSPTINSDQARYLASIRYKFISKVPKCPPKQGIYVHDKVQIKRTISIFCCLYFSKIFSKAISDLLSIKAYYYVSIAYIYMCVYVCVCN